MSRAGRLYSNSRGEVVELDDFATSLEGILGDLADYTAEVLEDAVRAGAKEAAKEWRGNAKAALHGDAYRKTIRFSTKALKGKPRATVYSTMPGLPHLLEKGHATIGGGRVRAYVHIRPAAEDGFDAAFDAAKNGIDAL